MTEQEAIIQKEIILDETKEYKIGILTDVHGNDEALKFCLGKLKHCDYIISLGDLSGIGPNSNEVYDIVTKLNNFYTILGNHERYLLFGFKNPLSCLTKEQQDFTEHSISKENIQYIEKLPLELNLKWKGKTICFLHYARRIFNGVRFKLIDHEPSYEKLGALFEYHNEDYLFYGHEHVGSIYELNQNSRHFINPGSCGCPCPTKNTTRYGVLTLNDTIHYEQFIEEYDASKTVQSMVHKNMPNKELIIKDFYREDISKYQK